MRDRRWLPIGILLALIVGAAVLAGPPGSDGPALDPRSTGPRGTKGVVEVLRELGVDVDIASGAGAGPVTLLLRDDLDDEGRADLVRWVERGNTLVLADPTSPLTEGRPVSTVGGAFAAEDLAGRCSIAGLQDVRRLQVPGAFLLEAPAGGERCFREDDGWYLVREQRARGQVLTVGGPGLFTNERLGQADNGLLAVRLLTSGAGEVTVLRPAAPGSGDKGLADLVAPSVKLALVQLGVAFVILALWRARRLGRPVLEPQPVQIAGSELVTAVGNLMQRAGSRAAAADAMRDDLRRNLAIRLGLPANSPAEVVADAAASGGTSRDTVLSAVAGPPPANEADLVALAHLVESVRQEVTRAPVV